MYFGIFLFLMLVKPFNEIRGVKMKKPQITIESNKCLK